ncbi:MAG: class I SAM-dependent methyltransferase [Limisphaerales bacterium]
MDKYSEIKNYYEHFYSQLREDAFPADMARYRAWFGQLLQERRPGAGMLDLGCGSGYVCSLFSRLGYAVAGVDISREAIARARRHEPGGDFKEATESGELPFPDHDYDLVTCLGVLEHIPHPEITVREMRRVCRANGRGIWVVPNASSPYFWFGGGTGQIEENPRPLAGWKSLLEQNGWQIERAFRDPGPLDSPAHGRCAHLKRCALKIMNRLPLSLTYQFVIYARPMRQIGHENTLR